ncbi:hypothetical protein ANCCAN_25522 [Ancylostoma caninum]|uniref:Uncharacterized protein n=1 Tax=Ancylostoma caninum TaxID=29170 RepID=A0A368F9B2_ANCCA|nr:hypothetical protein ANCCAN_25522 [Ancylostoma caninum]
MPDLSSSRFDLPGGVLFRKSEQYTAKVATHPALRFTYIGAAEVSALLRVTDFADVSASYGSAREPVGFPYQ